MDIVTSHGSRHWDLVKRSNVTLPAGSHYGSASGCRSNGDFLPPGYSTISLRRSREQVDEPVGMLTKWIADAGAFPRVMSMLTRGFGRWDGIYLGPPRCVTSAVSLFLYCNWLDSAKDVPGISRIDDAPAPFDHPLSMKART